MVTVELKDKKIKVVYNRKTGKMIPFMEKENGEIAIITTGAYNFDDIIVSMVNPMRLDLLNGYVLPEGVTYVED